MVLPLLGLAAGAVMRGVATRAVTSAGAKAAINGVPGRLASSAAGHYGVNAIQRGQQNRPVKRDHGITQHIRENPGEALAGAAYTLTRTNSIADNAMSATQSMLQSTQFGQGA